MVGRQATGIVVAALMVAACASSADEPPAPSASEAPAAAATTTTSSAPSSAPPERMSDPTPAPPTSETDGISVEEASELGVLAGDYDALLDGPVDAREADGCVVADVELRNVGAADDHYEVEATPAGTIVEPATVAVAAGEVALLEVTICADEPVVLTATSRGRDEPIAQLDLNS